jgi:alkanesulfonate monooxygenase SsuD/methylene tetrahydromethanopterin reductase-like flavin-dependent oxidoreductase (luciferase family)
VLVPLLREGHVDFAGRFYSARDCELLPRGPRPSGPPIWIAAFGPRLMRLAARWADAFNTSWHTDPRALAAPFEALDTACREVGRDPASIQRTIGTFVAVDPSDTAGRPGREGLRGAPERIAEQLFALEAAGASHITCLVVPPTARGIEGFAPVIEVLGSAA